MAAVLAPGRRLVFQALAVASLLATVTASACDEACCSSDGDCSDGVACFEGRCALRCDLDGACAEGERCVGGVCRGDDDNQVCAFEEVR